MPRLSAGDTVGRYVVEGVLGEGGMGCVYRALDPALARSVALKMLAGRPDSTAPGSDDDELVREARLLREARAVAKLEHPNIVAVHDVGAIDGRPFLVMELVRGKSLRDLIAEGSTPLEERLRWLLGIARALAAAHEAGVVHRDVKPSNVMIRDDGVVKVLDFGVARLSPSPFGAPGAADPELRTLTAVGTVVGTPRYMAPEQLSLQHVDQRADQFSWGVVAYEVLVGRNPWRVEDPSTELVTAVLTQAVEPFADAVPGLSRAVEFIVLKAMEKPPSDRFASMTELVARLEGAVFARTDPGENATKREARSARAPVRPRSSRALAGLALATFAAVAGAIFALRHATRAPGAAAAVSASTSAAAPPSRLTALTDLPLPRSTSPEALAEYRNGMQALRDGSYTANGHFARAVELDASLAAPQLRYAIWLIINHPTLARDHFARAVHARADLGEHDQILLDAYEPFVLRDPADLTEAMRRLRAGIERFPDDEELPLRLSSVADGIEPAAERDARLDRLIALDPKLGYAYFLRALHQAYAGDLEGSRRTCDACLRAVPAADMCLEQRIDVDEQMGTCAELEADARRAIAATGAGFDMLAEALASERRPLAAVREALAQGASRGPDPTPETSVYDDTAALALEVVSGQLAAAERLAVAAVAALDAKPQRGAHAYAMRRLIEIYVEEGKTAAAADVALDYLRRKDAWLADARGEDFAVARDPTPYMAAVATHASRMSPDELARTRAAWLASWRTAVRPGYAPFLWVHGWAETVQTGEEAREALAARADGEPIPRFWPQTFAGGDVGRTLLLAGRLDDAVDELTRASRACRMLAFPIELMRARYWLGVALEQRGDAVGACAAYGDVVDVWGRAQPASITAGHARERSAKLGCAGHTAK